MCGWLFFVLFCFLGRRVGGWVGGLGRKGEGGQNELLWVRGGWVWWVGGWVGGLPVIGHWVRMRPGRTSLALMKVALVGGWVGGLCRGEEGGLKEVL